MSASISAFPKIFALGTAYVREIFDGPVEVTEKVDGSQWAFGRAADGQAVMRSKGKIQYAGAVDKMFLGASMFVSDVAHMLPEGVTFYAEYLARPKHNIITYGRTPRNGLALFGVCGPDGAFSADGISEWSERLGIDRVPVVHHGDVGSIDDLTAILDRESYLGGANIEGVVVKNYAKPFMLGGAVFPIMAAKLVSEKFKEVHRDTWGKEHSGKGKIETFLESFRSEARWQKAVQRLAEGGALVGEPRDIGAIVREVHRDVEEEERYEIVGFLLQQFLPQVKNSAVKGLAEWYKTELAKQCFVGGGDK